ncbi:MAG: hypothetical protein ACLU6C_09555, partial [Streptococcus salivarius]|uniref:hypothetical protein n=1 Tax=Streptococcus pneumoniae TaxID=1313 RepID=UPI001CBBEEF0
STHSKNFLTLILTHHKAKSLAIKAFIIPFVQRFLSFYEQSDTLSGSLSPFCLRASTCQSRTAIAWAEVNANLRRFTP